MLLLLFNNQNNQSENEIHFLICWPKPFIYGNEQIGA